AVKQLGEGWNWRELKIGDRFKTFGRTLFETDLLNFVTLCGFSEELFTNKEYIAGHAPMRGGHPVPGALVYSMAEGLVIPTTLQGSGLAFLSMGFDIKRPTYVGDTIHVEIEVTEIKPTSKNPTRALVRPAGRIGEREVRRVLPALGRAAGRRRHGAPAAADRPQPRARHDPDRPRGRRPRGVRLGPRQPPGARRPGARRRQGAGRG